METGPWTLEIGLIRISPTASQLAAIPNIGEKLRRDDCRIS